MAVFAGKSVLVTGGSRGIGREIALRFADLGAARVALSYLRNDAAAEETAGEIRDRGAEALLLRGDVGDPEKAAAFVEELGTLDVLVSNAATGVIRPALELEERHWDWTMNANARAFLTLARNAARAAFSNREPAGIVLRLRRPHIRPASRWEDKVDDLTPGSPASAARASAQRPAVPERGD